MTIEETIDAFLDGERVDVLALEAALASTEGRTYMFDALGIRQLLGFVVSHFHLVIGRHSTLSVGD